MAGALRGHSLHNVGSAQPSSTPAMSFDTRAQGTPASSSAFPAYFSPSPMPYTSFGFAPFSNDSTTSKQIATLQAKLDKKLGPEYISQRPGPSGGPKLTYAEGWKIINLANEVFGFNGWSSSVVSIVTDFLDYSDESKRYNVGVTAIVRVTLKDGAYHEDVGYGMLENSKSKAAALDKCKKEAVTDALKRTLRNFGNLLGNCLYDKSYAQEVVKIKIPPVKFDKNELHRRPEFEERTAEGSSSASYGQASIPGTSSTTQEEPRVKAEYGGNQPESPITYVPRHLRQEMAAAAQQAQAQTPARAPTSHQWTQTHPTPSGSGSSAIAVPVTRGPSPTTDAPIAPKPNGLATPIQTPARAQRPPPPRAPPPRAVATSPLAQTTSAPDRSVSFAELTLIPAERAGSADVSDQPRHDVDQAPGQGTGCIDDDDDAFPLSTQDGLLFASVDLGDGDLGRPIEFEEGIGGVSMLDTAECEAELALPQVQVRDRTGSAGSSSSSFGAPAKTNVRPEVARGGFHPAPIAKPPIRHSPKPVPACVRTSASALPSAGPSNALKRSADAMQAGSSARPPVQGMGLAQREHQHHPIAGTSARRPPEGGTNDGHDPKRLKR